MPRRPRSFPSARPRSHTSGAGFVRGGFEGVVDPATRRALLDLKRTVVELEHDGGGGGGVDWYQDPAPPTTGDNGETWYQPATNTLYVLEGGVWTPVTSGGGSGESGFSFTQDTQPVAAVHGQTWYDTSTGNSFVWIEDPDGVQWVQFAPGEGSTGGGGGDIDSYTHVQGTAAATWVITHNLGWYPNVSVIDSSGSIVEGELTHLSSLSLRLMFSGAFTGTAYLS